MTQENKTIRAAVIGAGPTTNLLHLPALAGLFRQGRIELAVICDIKPELAAATQETFGFLEACGDAIAAIERPDIDAVYVLGSAQMHYEFGRLALEHGKHLFVEKPVAPSFAQACELAKRARANGLVAVGGHNRRFHRSVEIVRARAGATRFRFAEAVFHKPELGKPPLFGAKSWLSANGIHALDALLYVMGGMPEELHAFAGGAAGPEHEVFSAVMRWSDGAQASFLCNNEAGARREDYSFHAPGESITITEEALTIARNGAVTTSRMPARDGFDGEHEAFIDAIRCGETPRHTLEALAPSLLLAELIETGYQGRVTPPQFAEPGPHRQQTQSILLMRPNGTEKALGRLLGDYRLVSPADLKDARTDLAAAVLGDASTPLPGEMLDKLPNLSVVGASALSISRLKPEELQARGIALVNAKTAYAESVAEFALGLAILGRRRAFLSHAVMRKGGWGTRPLGPIGYVLKRLRGLRASIRDTALEPVLLSAWRKAKPLVVAGDARAGETRDLKGATAGLIGWSANAQAFTVRLIAAGVRVKVFSENADPADIRTAGAEPASLAEVLIADVVSLHRGLTERTRHCLGAAELALLQPGAVLINIARGALIEPKALYARLRKGDVFACLDTFEIEPPARRDRLRRLPNVFLTSHIAGGSRDMHAAAAEEVVQKVDAWLKGETIEPVTRERLETMS